MGRTRWGGNGASKKRGPADRGALLLEVLVALAILVAAVGLLAAELSAGLRMTARGDQLTRAAALTDRLLALIELDPKMQEQILLEQQTTGDFGEAHPGWFWRITLEPTEVAGLGLVRAEVLYAVEDRGARSFDDAVLVREVGLLKAAPGRIDLAADLGMDEEQIAGLLAVLPMADFDPTAVDPQQLVALFTDNPALLLELAQMSPALMPLLRQFGGGGRGAGALALGNLGEMFGGEGGGGGLDGSEALEELARLGDQMGRPGGGPPTPRMPTPLAPPPGGGPGMGGVEGGGRPGMAPPRGGMRGGGRSGGIGRLPPAGGVPPGGGMPPAGMPPPGQAGAPQYTIEDLLRMRDEALRRQGGGGR